MAAVGPSSLRASALAELRALPLAARGALPFLIKMGLKKTTSLLDVVIDNAEAVPSGLALEMDDEKLSWLELEQQSSRIAHVLSAAGVKQGDVVVLLANNSPLYVAIILGACRVGATTALVNNNLEGRPLAHALKAAKARVGVIDARYEAIVNSLPEVDDFLPKRFVCRSGDFEQAVAAAPSRPFTPAIVSKDDDFVYIYTSGTTGMPKPCRVSHSRAVMAGALFGAVMFEFGPGDKLYSTLPLYHANALLLGLCACVTTRTPMAMRDGFSARSFWSDAKRYDATAMLYIGELCRFMLAAPPSPDDRAHRIRVAVGNGMRSDVWGPFQERFGVTHIREFYAATEAPGFLLNLTGKVGAIGRLPKRGLGWLSIAKYDIDRDELIRDASGRCIRCEPNEVGELLIRLPQKVKIGALEFRGYTDAEATKKKVLTDVFQKGDVYFRSGDLLRQDDEGHYYFVDRIGDTFRSKGENVSTAEVADVLSASKGVREVTVVGVKLPAIDGQLGLAAVVADDFDPADFHAVARELPSYAQPRFVRLLDSLDMTGTFKVQKGNLRKDGADPARITDALYVWSPEGYEKLTDSIYEEIIAGTRRI